MQLVLTRRHRLFTIFLSVIIAGIFFVFIARVFLSPAPSDEPRPCNISPRYKDMKLQEAQNTYHWTMQQLIEERMNIYEGRIPLACSEEDMADVIPVGEYTKSIAEKFPHLGTGSTMTYADFPELLTEVWRDYDCHLFHYEKFPNRLGNELIKREQSSSSTSSAGEDSVVLTYGGVTRYTEVIIERERLIARYTLERVMLVLRSSEQYLPLHASLQCALRGFTDVRNALALFSDASQCLMPSIVSPSSSILK